MKGNNPVDSYGNMILCKICRSINHRENVCPDKKCENRFQETSKGSNDSYSYTDGSCLTYKINYVESLKENNSKNIPLSCQNVQPVLQSSKKEKRLNTSNEENQHCIINSGENEGLDKFTIDQVKNGLVLEHCCEKNSESVNNLSHGVESMTDMHFKSFDTPRHCNQVQCCNNLQNSAFKPAYYKTYSKSVSRPTCYTYHRPGHISRDCVAKLNQNPRTRFNCHQRVHTPFRYKDLPRKNNINYCEKQTNSHYHGTQSLNMIPRGRVVKDKYYSLYRHQNCFRCDNCY